MLRNKLLFALLLLLLCGCTPKMPHIITKTDFKDSPYCVLLIVDALGPDVLAAGLKDGELPNIKKHIVDRGMTVRNMISAYPSITAGAITTMLTGVYPGTHQIPNFQWVNRKDGTFRCYIGGDIKDMEKDIYDHTRTIFQYLPEDQTASFGFIQGRQAGKDDSLFFTSLNPFHKNAPLSHLFLSDMFGQLGLGKGIPHLLALYQWRVDVEGHLKGPFSKEVRDELREVDDWFGHVVSAYQERGLYDKTYFILASDHGLAPVKETFYLDIALHNAGFRRKLISYNLGESLFPNSWARADSIWFKHEEVTGYDTVVGSAGGGQATLDFVMNTGRLPTGEPTLKAWAEHPVYEELRRFQLQDGPLIRQRVVDVIAFLRDLEPVNFFFLRENRPKKGEAVKVLIVSKNGIGRVTRRARRDEPSRYDYAYETVEGEDPLGYARDARIAELMRTGFHDGLTWREATAEHAYPDVPVQVTHIFDTERSGTVHVTLKPGWSVNSQVAGKHGGYERAEMTAVFCMAGPGLSHGEIRQAGIADITPTILALLLKGDFNGRHFDGRPIPEIVEKAGAP